MERRINIQLLEPQAYKAMYGLSHYLQTSGLEKKLTHLIKIRSSQINGCSFCIDMHANEAMKEGEHLQRILLLNAWKESDLFTEKEKAALAVTEEVTLISQHGLSDQIYENARKFFDPNLLAQLIMSIVTINAWNRIAVSTRMQPTKSLES